MLHFAARVALILILLALILAAVRTLIPGSVPSSELIAALDPGDCTMPCWQGIRPGVTTMREAVWLLHTSPLIDPNSIHPSGGEGIAFTACWKSPDVWIRHLPADQTELCITIDNRPGENLVQDILVHANVPLGDFLMRFGVPARTSMGTINRNLYYVLEYPDLGMQYDAVLDCKPDQQLVTAYGSTYVLQALDSFIPQISRDIDLGWNGFSNWHLNTFATSLGCGR